MLGNVVTGGRTALATELGGGMLVTVLLPAEAPGAGDADAGVSALLEALSSPLTEALSGCPSVMLVSSSSFAPVAVLASSPAVLPAVDLRVRFVEASGTPASCLKALRTMRR